MLCAKFGWHWPSGSGEEDFLISSMYFRYFVIISPWERVGPFIWTNLNPLHQRMLCAKFGWNWLSGSREEDFLISSMYFRYFLIISPWKRAGPPYILTNLNSLHPKDDLCQVWLKLDQWFLRRRFLNLSNVFSLFRNYLPLTKGWALHFKKIESPPPKDALCQVWMKLAECF